jgi:hypothetical protein
MTDRAEGKREKAHRWAIDGIEEGMARVEEDGARTITVPAYLLPPGAKDGDILRVTRAAGREQGTVTLTIAVDEQATSEALARSKATTARAAAESRKRDPGGDVAL